MGEKEKILNGLAVVIARGTTRGPQRELCAQLGAW